MAPYIIVLRRRADEVDCMQKHLHSNGIIGKEAGMVGSEACPNQCILHRRWFESIREEKTRLGRRAGVQEGCGLLPKATDTFNFLREEKLLVLETITLKKPKTL